jgi:hypothetical protein
MASQGRDQFAEKYGAQDRQSGVPTGGLEHVFPYSLIR